jgi:chemotaxis protein CheX
VDVNSINPILKAFAEILPQIGFQDIAKKGISLEGSTLENPGILINIGVMGPLKGAILIGMSIDNAHQFASKMMMGMPVSELDELAQSALAEMGNMVCANACSLFSQTGVVGLDISPPSLLVGKGGQVRLSVPKMIVVNFSADGIAVDVYVGLFS